MLWSAHGLSLNDPNPDLCSRELVPVGEKITRDYYFGRNRLKKIDYPGLTADTDYTWFPDGQLETASRNSSVWTYFYNPRGLLESESLTFAGQTRAFTHAYDTLGTLQSTTYPGGEPVGYAPNALGQPRQVGSYASGVLYNEDGSLSQVDFANGIQHTRPLNGRLYPERLRYALGTQKQVDLRYTYDLNGNVSAITDERSVAPTDSQTFGYDDLDRLTSAATTTLPPGNYGSAVYTYDAFDNLRRYQLGTRDRRYQYSDGTGRLTRLTQADNVTSVEEYGYDPRGNLNSTLPAGGTTTTTEFDRADTLISIVGQASYRYDAHGHRIEVVAGGQSRYPVYTRDGLLRAEYGSTDRDTYYYLGNQLIASQRSSLGGDTLFRDSFENPTPAVTTWYLADHLGSNVATTSATGAILERSQFAPFGERLEAPAERGPGYAGHFEDSASLTYMKARYYGAVVGRFISPDPMDVNPATGANFNRYWYANNNPYKYTDPDGRESAMFQRDEYRMAQPDAATMATALGLAADFTPIVGDIKGFAEAFQNPTFVNIAAATVGLVPGVGDAAGKILKNGDGVLDSGGSGLRNGRLAGGAHPKTEIPFDKAGFPDFSSVSKAEVQIAQTGTRAGDFRAANVAAGFSKTPEGLTWHHHQDGKTMQLVPREIHAKTGHTGGFKLGQ